MKRASIFVVAVALLVTGGFLQGAAAQDKPLGQLPDLFNLAQPGGDDLGGFGGGGAEVKAELVPKDARAGEEVTLRITVTVPPGSWTYSQNRERSAFTTITLTETVGLDAVDAQFQPDHPPKLVDEPEIKQTYEKFFGEVTWSRKFRIPADAQTVKAAGKISLQVCNDQNCTPHDETFLAEMTPAAGSELPEGAVAAEVYPYTLQTRPEYQKKPGPTDVSVRLFPENAGPGETVTLAVTLKMDKGWHTYSMTQPKGIGSLPTELILNTFNGLEEIDATFRPEQKFEIKQTEIPGEETITQEVYQETVTWSRTFRVLADATGYGVSGSAFYQVCTDARCLNPAVVEFSLGDLTAQRDASHLNGLPPRVSAGDLEFQVDVNEAGSLGLFIVYAFLGGLILNIMPCVLPVLAIKILSFVKQAGESRSRILQLNLAYSVGVILVFLCLASLAAFAQLGWGQLFQSSEFNIVMACIVFAMGLSLLGVFEIPIPGLAGGASREGIAGAFLTGVFATFLATPCSGPFMGATLAWSVKQPTAVIYVIWGVMGLGMAFPYLLCGLFPSALKVLPKPGAWMVRFKEFSGFALMGAVIFIMSYIDATSMVPLLIMLMGIALGLWMVGNLYDAASPIQHKNMVRVLALVLSVGIIGWGYTRLLPESQSEHKLPWVQFSERTLEESIAQNKTVLIDFTADWCLVCKKNEAFALNTEETLQLVEQHGVVPLYADYTSRSPEIQKWLKTFESISVPLTVILPAGNYEKPIVLRDSFSQDDLLSKLNEALDGSGTAPVKQQTADQAEAPVETRETSQAEPPRLPWGDFSSERLSELRNGNRTVLVHVSADWCLLCKKNEAFALNTEETLEVVKQHGVVPLYGDYTERSPKLQERLHNFDSVSIPLTVIFPADQQREPIVLRGDYSQEFLLGKLNEAL